jgi:hypothetical protein
MRPFRGQFDPDRLPPPDAAKSRADLMRAEREVKLDGFPHADRPGGLAIDQDVKALLCVPGSAESGSGAGGEAATVEAHRT